MIMSNRDVIQLKILYEGEEYIIHTYQREYRSLMHLIQDKLYPFDFGECGGMGRCATCQVRLGQPVVNNSMDRNESSTLSKFDVTDPTIRLSCQLLVDKELDNIPITVISE